MNNKKHNIYCIDETVVALACLTVICMMAIGWTVEGVKDILLATVGGIVGFLSKAMAEKGKQPSSAEP